MQWKNIALLFEDKCLKNFPPQYTKAYVADVMKLQKCRPKYLGMKDKFCLV